MTSTTTESPISLSGAYSTFLRGPWFAHQEAYLGVKFVIKGSTHYGWVRVTVGGYLSFYTVVGYAYETVPNKPISTGATFGPVKTSTLSRPAAPTLDADGRAASLGLLARGADALAIWRRDENLVAKERG